MQHTYQPRLSADVYLSGEIDSDIRHEYVDGEVYAMAGAPDAHNLIALNATSRLRGLVRGGPEHLEYVGAMLSLDEVYEDIKFMSNAP